MMMIWNTHALRGIGITGYGKLMAFFVFLIRGDFYMRSCFNRFVVERGRIGNILWI